MRAFLVALTTALSVGIMSPTCASSCLDMAGLPPLESMSVGKKPIRVVVEALLHDAETIYKEGSHIVAQNPRTNREADAISTMEAQHVGGESFHIKECNFQEAFYPMMQGAQSKYPEDVAFTLVRIGQFDNFIFNAVNEALSCSNTQAQFDLSLSRQMLDHASMEFNGHPEERDWDPNNLAGPEKRESCR
ncbi:MAG: hypothetical protein ACLP8A_16100 [Methylovirgula sp.]